MARQTPPGARSNGVRWRVSKTSMRPVCCSERSLKNVGDGVRRGMTIRRMQQCLRRQNPAYRLPATMIPVAQLRSWVTGFFMSQSHSIHVCRRSLPIQTRFFGCTTAIITTVHTVFFVAACPQTAEITKNNDDNTQKSSITPTSTPTEWDAPWPTDAASWLRINRPTSILTSLQTWILAQPQNNITQAASALTEIVGYNIWQNQTWQDAGIDLSRAWFLVERQKKTSIPKNQTASSTEQQKIGAPSSESAWLLVLPVTNQTSLQTALQAISQRQNWQINHDKLQIDGIQIHAGNLKDEQNTIVASYAIRKDAVAFWFFPDDDALSIPYLSFLLAHPKGSTASVEQQKRPTLQTHPIDAHVLWRGGEQKTAQLENIESLDLSFSLGDGMRWQAEATTKITPATSLQLAQAERDAPPAAFLCALAARSVAWALVPPVLGDAVTAVAGADIQNDPSLENDAFAGAIAWFVHDDRKMTTSQANRSENIRETRETASSPVLPLTLVGMPKNTEALQKLAESASITTTTEMQVQPLCAEKIQEQTTKKITKKITPKIKTSKLDAKFRKAAQKDKKQLQYDAIAKEKTSCQTTGAVVAAPALWALSVGQQGNPILTTAIAALQNKNLSPTAEQKSIYINHHVVNPLCTGVPLGMMDQNTVAALAWQGDQLASLLQRTWLVEMLRQGETVNPWGSVARIVYPWLQNMGPALLWAKVNDDTLQVFAQIDWRMGAK